MPESKAVCGPTPSMPLGLLSALNSVDASAQHCQPIFQLQWTDNLICRAAYELAAFHNVQIQGLVLETESMCVYVQLCAHI
jgi:hypothetical protein